MKTKGRKSKNVQDLRNKRIAPDIVGIARRNADAAGWEKSVRSVPKKVKSDMDGALRKIRRNSAVKQTRGPSVTKDAQKIKEHLLKKGRTKEKK